MPDTTPTERQLPIPKWLNVDTIMTPEDLAEIAELRVQVLDVARHTRTLGPRIARLECLTDELGVDGLADYISDLTGISELRDLADPPATSSIPTRRSTRSTPTSSPRSTTVELKG